jgi:hypothetical protein
MTVVLTPPTYPGFSLAKAKTPFDHLAQTAENAATLTQVVKGGASDDDHLGHLDGEMRLAGGATIAALSAKLRTGRWAALPEALGLVSWFSSMAVTPFVLHKLIKAKTGVDLGQTYITPEHRRARMFTDPDYMPLALIPKPELDRMAQRLGIPLDHPHYRELTEEKIREVAREGQTAWMLLAGLSTPVLTALAGSTLQQPLASGVTQLQSNGLQMAHALARRINPALGDAVLKQWLTNMNGPMMDQWMTRWTAMLAKHWQLPLKGAENPTKTQLVNQLHQLGANALEQVEHRLKQDQLRLDKLKQLVTDQASYAKTPLTPLVQQVTDKLAYAHNSVERQLGLMAQVSHHTPETVSHWLDGHRLNRVEHIIKQGQMQWLNQLLGDKSARKAVTLLANKDMTGLNTLIGAPPGTVLLNAWQQAARQAGWRNRYLIGAGGLTAMAAALLVAVGVGRKATPDQLLWNDGPFDLKPGELKRNDLQKAATPPLLPSNPSHTGTARKTVTV